MILVVGSESHLAQSIKRVQSSVRPKEPWQYIESQTLNYSNESELEKQIQSYQAHALINCTGLEDILTAESNEALARERNITYVEALSKVCDKLNVKLVNFSTNFVFEGVVSVPLSEEASTSPLSIYGRTKLAGEKSALLYKQNLIIRYSWLYGLEDLGILKEIFEKSKSYQSVNLSDEYVSSPTHVDDLVNALFVFLDKKASGLYHYTNVGPTSHLNLASHFITAYNNRFSTKLNPPIKTDFNLYPNKALLPKSAILNIQKAQSLGIKIPSWKNSLDLFVKTHMKA